MIEGQIKMLISPPFSTSFWVLGQGQNTLPQMVPGEDALRDTLFWGGGFLGALLISYLAKLILRAQGFDTLFRPPWKPMFSKPDEETHYASSVVSWGLFATLLVVFAWQLGQYSGNLVPGIETALRFTQQFWALLLTCLVAFGIARFVAATILSIFQNPTVRRQLEMICPQEPQPAAGLTPTTSTEQAEAIDDEEENETEQAPSTNRQTEPESFADTVARVVGLLIYGLVLLPVMMIAAEIWGWNTTGTTVAQIWSWLLPFAGLTAVITIGWFALTAAAISITPPEQRRAVMIATTSLAVILLSASYNATLAIIVGVGLAAIGWFARKDLPDVFAGIHLKMQPNLKIRTIYGTAEVPHIGLLVSRIRYEDRTFHTRNRHVHRAFLDGSELTSSQLIDTTIK